MIYGDPVNLQGLREDIYYLGSVNAASLPPNDLRRIVNKYYGQLQEVVRQVNENFYMAVATTDLYIGNGSYTYPDGTGTAPSYEKIKSIWAAYLPKNINAPLPTEYERANIVDPDSISNPAYTFSTPTATMFGTYFILSPMVTDVTKYPVIDGVKMYYIAEQQALVNDTDVPVIFPTFTDAIVQGSLIDVAQRTGDKQLKADSIKLFAKRLKDIQAYASGRIPPEIGIVEGQDGEGGWVYPWGQNSMS